MLLFAKFRAKTRRMNLIFEIGHEGTKLITPTEENLFKGIKFCVSIIRVVTK